MRESKFQFLRQYFFAGLLVIIPIAVSFWVFLFFFRVLWGVYYWLPTKLQPEILVDPGLIPTLLRSLITFGLLLGLAFGVAFLGWASSQYLGTRILAWLNGLLKRIPIIRSVYTALLLLMKTFSEGGGKQFRRVVYVEYPRKDVWAIGFVTAPVKLPHTEKKHLNVFVPTVPNPTSGFHLIVPEADVRDSGMGVEEAFRTLLSLGLVQKESEHPSSTSSDQQSFEWEKSGKSQGDGKQ